MNEIRKLIMWFILEFSKSVLAPIFTGIWERAGAVIINYANQQSVEWLKNPPILKSEV